MQLISNIGYNIRTIFMWMGRYYQGGFFLLAALVAWIYLYKSYKELRYKFLFPILAMMIFVLNPFLPQQFYNIFMHGTYWRFFWLLPSALLIGAATVLAIRNAEKLWIKCTLLAVICLAIVIGGENMFTNGGFEKRSNWEKISQETIDVCDYLLEVDRTPSIVAPEDIFTEVRQYAPQIKMLYGRNVYGFIGTADEETLRVFGELAKEDPDYTLICEQLETYEIGFFIVDKEVDVTVLQQHGYVEINRIHDNVIYYNEEIANRS